jgi:hypothetical protein
MAATSQTGFSANRVSNLLHADMIGMQLERGYRGKRNCL